MKLKNKSALENVREYTDNTTIHGVKYLGEKNRPATEKCFWIITFIISFIILGSFINELVHKWQERSVILVEDTVPTQIYEIPFPAVTICPQFKINSEFYNYDTAFDEINKYNLSYWSLNDIGKMQYEMALQICDRTITRWAKSQHRHHFNLTHLTKEHIFTLLEMRAILSLESLKFSRTKFPSCTVGSELCENMFPTVITNEGVCYTFNLPKEILRAENLQTDYHYYNINHNIQGWDYERGYFEYPSFPRRTWAVGESYSLSSTLRSSSKDLYNYCEPTNLGYKILIHSPAVYPNLFINFILLDHEVNYKIKVKPKITTTSSNLRSYTPQQRQCYFNDERQLQFFKFYNKDNCKLECFANYTIAKYGCVHFSIPRNNSTPICGPGIDFHEAYDDCDNSQSLTSFSKTVGGPISLTKRLHKSPNVTCDCLPECNAIDYEYHIDMYNEKKQLADAKARHTSFDVYFTENSVIGMTRKQLYTFADLVSNFGGLVGLFIGASILSIFEIIYFCVIRQISGVCLNAEPEIG